MRRKRSATRASRKYRLQILGRWGHELTPEVLEPRLLLARGPDVSQRPCEHGPKSRRDRPQPDRREFDPVRKARIRRPRRVCLRPAPLRPGRGRQRTGDPQRRVCRDPARQPLCDRRGHRDGALEGQFHQPRQRGHQRALAGRLETAPFFPRSASSETRSSTVRPAPSTSWP